MKTTQAPHKLSDTDLIAELKRLASSERIATVDLLRTLMEFDARRLYLGEGYSSLFAYCTRVLHYAEHAALNRIEVARAAIRCPVVLQHLTDGRVHLTGVRLLAPHLTAENADKILGAARYKSKREIEELIAGLRPRPAVISTLRKVPAPTQRAAADPRLPAVSETTAGQLQSRHTVAVMRSPPQRSMVMPLAPECFKLQFTISRETRDKLRQVQDLMRHTVPNGDPAVIFDRALTLLFENLQRKRFASTSAPRSVESVGPAHTRRVPAAVRRAVWHRDGGRCAFAGSHGRCAEQGFLEFHHVMPFAAGGLSTVENIELRCRAHNAYEASLFSSAEVARGSDGGDLDAGGGDRECIAGDQHE